MSHAAPCSPTSQIRILFVLAAVMVLAASLLAVTVSPWFLLLAVVTGVSQLSFAATGACPASLMLRRICRGREGA